MVSPPVDLPFISLYLLISLNMMYILIYSILGLERKDIGDSAPQHRLNLLFLCLSPFIKMIYHQGPELMVLVLSKSSTFRNHGFAKAQLQRQVKELKVGDGKNFLPQVPKL